MFKAEMFRRGLPIECRWHGVHTQWRLHNKNNIQCRLCSRENSKIYNNRNTLKYLMHGIKRREPTTEITIEFLAELLNNQNNCCALTGFPFDEQHKPSIDRIDSNKGYSKENVQLVLFDINRMKTDLELDTFKLLCKKVSSYQDMEYGLTGC